MMTPEMSREMSREMSDVEQEYLQSLVCRIATHIVEGSAAIHELKSTVARLKNERSDIEYAVYEHWLKAAKTIEAAGKEKSSWEKFLKSLRMSYGDKDKDMIASEEHLLPIASKELWTHGEARNNVGISSTSTMPITDHRFAETVDHSFHFGKRIESNKQLDLSERIEPYDMKPVDQSFHFGNKSESNKQLDLSERIEPSDTKLVDQSFHFGNKSESNKQLDLSERIEPYNTKLVDHSFHFGKRSESNKQLDLSERIEPYDTKKLAQVAMTIGEPNYKTSKTSKLDLSERIEPYDTKKLAQVAMTIGEPNYKTSKTSKLDLSERIEPYDTKKLAQVAMTIGEPNYKTSKTSKGKRKLEDLSELLGEGGGGGKKKSFIQFTNGRKIGSEKVVALKKGGRCFFCERKGHRAAECKENPDIQRKA